MFKKLCLILVAVIFASGLYGLDINQLKNDAENYSKKYLDLVAKPDTSASQVEDAFKLYQNSMKKLDEALKNAGQGINDGIDQTRDEYEKIRKEVENTDGIKGKLETITGKAKEIKGKLEGIFKSVKNEIPNNPQKVEEVLANIEVQSIEEIVEQVQDENVLLEVNEKLAENGNFSKLKELAEKLLEKLQPGSVEYVQAENQVIVADAGLTREEIKNTETKFTKKYPKSFFNIFNPVYHVNRVKHAVNEWKAKKKLKTSYNQIVNRYNFAIRQRLQNPGVKKYEVASQRAEAQLKQVFSSKKQVFQTVDHSMDIVDFEKLRQDIEKADVNDVFDSIDVGDNDVLGKIRLITYNPEAWWARYKVMSEAKKSIVVTYFILEKDIFGDSLLGVLLKKAKAGINIKLMMDARGTKNYTKTFLGQDVLQELKQYPNVEIRVYNPTHRAILKLLDNVKTIVSSNHDKIIVVDDESVIVGGRNVSMNYFVDVEDDGTVFRDTDVYIESKGVASQIMTAFNEEFNRLSNFKISEDMLWNTERETELNMACKCIESVMMSKGLLDPESGNFNKDEKEFINTYNEELSKYPRLAGMDKYNPFPTPLMVPIKILDKHGLIEHTRNDITPNLIALMDNCKEEIIIQNPYVVITPKAREALTRASNRGVKVIIHTNSPVSTDSILTQSVFIRDWKDLLKAMPNLSIQVNKGDSKLHAKVFCFDKKVSVIGTYNMDYMSEQINSEVVAVIKNEEFSADNRARILEDIRKTAVEYKIDVTPDGEVKVIYGPENHCPESLLRKVRALGKLKFLTPII